MSDLAPLPQTPEPGQRWRTMVGIWVHDRPVVVWIGGRAIIVGHSPQYEPIPAPPEPAP